MNLYQAELMDKPSLKASPRRCCVCGKLSPTEHHIVARSQGGKDGPTIDLCGHGTAGCHGMAESKQLHFRYTDRWEYLSTFTPYKYERALARPGWAPVPYGEELTR